LGGARARGANCQKSGKKGGRARTFHDVGKTQEDEREVEEVQNIKGSKT